jgi:hypothetical protein
MSKTYHVRADVTFYYELLVEADNEKDLFLQLRRGCWDGQFMHESNDLMKPTKVENVEIIEVTDEN